MARSSILGADRAPAQAPGRDSGALGPSDSSDSGSDIQGKLDLSGGRDEFGTVQPGPGSDSDAEGTGEREAGDIAPDHVRRISEEALSGDTEASEEEPESTEDVDTASLALDETDDDERPDDEPDAAT
jgi:hypothetical protein